MKNIFQLIVTMLLSASLLSGCHSDKIKALIVTGQNNHNWKESHVILQKILENSDAFTVETSVSPAKGEDMSSFAPDFSAFDVVVLDYNGDEWSEKTKKSFDSYVKNGGGVVVYHASDNSFPNWKEYNEMIGIGGWEGRNEKSGPYVYYNDRDELIRDNSVGSAGDHGPQHEFVIEIRDTEHPIVKGMPKRWLHSQDELYSKLRGPAQNMSIIATAYSNTTYKGTGRHEPILMTIEYGKGRVFHTVIGHVGNEKVHYATQDAGFILTLQRGAEWAATGEVKQKLPEDLPNVGSAFLLPDYKFYTLDDLFSKAKSFEYGKAQKYLYLISNRIREAKGDTKKLNDFEDRILNTMQSDDATNECKNYLCRELSWMGSDKSLPVLNELLKNNETAEMAQFALTRLQQ
jgi:type 1 glutamine amidotransferase